MAEPEPEGEREVEAVAPESGDPVEVNEAVIVCMTVLVPPSAPVVTICVVRVITLGCSVVLVCGVVDVGVGELEVVGATGVVDDVGVVVCGVLLVVINVVGGVTEDEVSGGVVAAVGVVGLAGELGAALLVGDGVGVSDVCGLAVLVVLDMAKARGFNRGKSLNVTTAISAPESYREMHCNERKENRIPMQGRSIADEK
jgi:hypothetical protein